MFKIINVQSKVILRKPVNGHRGRGRPRPRTTFVDNLLINTGAEIIGELETLMLDRMVWIERGRPGSSGSSR